MRIGLPLLCNVCWGLFTLVGVSTIFHAPLSFLRYIAPDFAGMLLVSGVVALAWSILGRLLAYGALRTPVAPRPVTIAAKASLI